MSTAPVEAARRSQSPPPIPAELQAAIAAAEALSLAARSRVRRSSSRAPSAGSGRAAGGGGRDSSRDCGDGGGGGGSSGGREGDGAPTSRWPKLKVTRAQVRAAARRVQHRFCVDVLAALAAAPFAAAFLRPVTELWGPEHIRGYASMIEVPCDLGLAVDRDANAAAPVEV